MRSAQATISLLLAGLLAFPVWGDPLPEMGPSALHTLSLPEESLMGKLFMRKLRAQVPLNADPFVLDYLNNLGGKLSRRVKKEVNFPFHFFMVEHDDLNAFAFFGGYVGIHRGLFLSCQSESELAAAIAHEISHVSQRHLARLLAEHKKMMPLTMAELLGSILLGAIAGADIGLHAANAVMAGHTQRVINYTREHEQEADRLGIQLLHQAGFDPHGLPALIEHLEHQSRYHDKPPEYLSTHPLYHNRSGDAHNRADQFAYQQILDSEDFYLIKARLEAQKLSIEELKHRLQKGLYTKKAHAEYAYALGLLERQQTAQALPILKALSLAEPQQVLFQASLAEGEFVNGQVKSALQRLADLHRLHPKHYGILFTYAQCLQGSDPAKTETLLLKARQLQPEDANIYPLLVKTYRHKGQELELHQAQAEWFGMHYQWQAALRQLEIAKQHARSESQKARLEQQQGMVYQLIKEGG